MRLINLVRSEFLKMKHTYFYSIHICIPIIGSIMVLMYYGTSKINIDAKIQLYLGVISIAFPLLISIVTSQVMKVEKDAGAYKEILSSEYGRISCILSKMIMLLVCGFISLLIAVGIFVFGIKYIFNQYSISFMIYIKSIMIIFECQIIIYVLHAWLNLRFNCGISMLIGTFETVLSALLETGLGDNIWQWIPSGINMRLNQYYILKSTSLSFIDKINENICLGLRNSIVLTVLSVIIFICWFNKYDAPIEN
ncbi:lantibiotic immunity ABC transporter MutG family permease subunit [Inconstantimicrobium porci]|uniref:lantibiotic immunity ABC transporter MutG family permease subunit n=1 Tax=Inconstantimicrobium porci TaxID=2652291 RepID=UPI00240984AF|nr:lantibiotic immunity ABC transporter MutG family permease subunit [Inconstantimicrobium porci]MDD6769568.1 lantibiotic immunity ABC transporter MutG family permease subunit [Inconstantimicrobium porci]